MKGEFIIRIDDSLYTYNNYEDIPEEFDNVIKFSPEYPSEPHSEEDHDLIHSYVDKLHELMKREKR